MLCGVDLDLKGLISQRFTCQTPGFVKIRSAEAPYQLLPSYQGRVRGVHIYGCLAVHRNFGFRAGRVFAGQ